MQPFGANSYINRQTRIKKTKSSNKPEKGEIIEAEPSPLMYLEIKHSR